MVCTRTGAHLKFHKFREVHASQTYSTVCKGVLKEHLVEVVVCCKMPLSESPMALQTVKDHGIMYIHF